MALADRMLARERRLSAALAALRFGAPVSHTYNPLDYARRPHAQFVRRYARAPLHAVALGMNPGPYGMAQTGVPFGEVAHVRDWLGIEGAVARPAREHPKRPIEGFACARSEISGARLWGALRVAYGRPEKFFARHFVLNYCPLVFMEASGRNLTPDKLPAAVRAKLLAACDEHLRAQVALLRPQWVVGVGRFAEARAREALSDVRGLRIAGVLHPSPASPASNGEGEESWAAKARAQLRAQGVCAR